MLIKFETPRWLDTVYHTTKYAWNSAKWIVKPPRCSKCGARLHSTSSEYHISWDHEKAKLFHMKSITVGDFSMGDKIWCNNCIREEIDTGTPENTKWDYKARGLCDCCDSRHKPVWRFFETKNIKLHFCLQWWNGFFVCRDCMRIALIHGENKTGIVRIVGNKMLSVGAYGLLMKAGKVQLFKKVKW